MLVYGRPGAPRNAFELVVAGLRIWAKTYPHAGAWRLISLGARHGAISIAPNLSLTSRGKVSLEAYTDYLRRSAVGLSLMISPHPSYPPLEMAAFGVRVVTNNFANKDLSAKSPFIKSVGEVTPVRIAEALFQQCEAFEI